MVAKKPVKAPTSSEPKALSIYGYTDFRAYLRDFYTQRKESHRGYSFRAFSKAAGFTSPNILKLVIDGERNISPAATEKFCKALHLEGQKAAYFAVLVNLNQSRSDAEKAELFEQLRKLTPASKQHHLNVNGMTYLSHWLYPVIREMALLDDFRDDPYWIARRLHTAVPLAQITQALQFLIKEGYLEKVGERYQPRDHLVLSSDEVRSLAIRNYHRQMLDQAKEALELLPLEQREFGALIVVLPSEAMDKLKDKMKAFRKDLHAWSMQMVSDHGSGSVVQVNLQMYPHTKQGAS